jgi:hypothetical protein
VGYGVAFTTFLCGLIGLITGPIIAIKIAKRKLGNFYCGGFFLKNGLPKDITAVISG